MSKIEATVQHAHVQIGGVSPSNPPPTLETHDSNVDGSAIEINSRPMFGLDDIELEDVQQPPHSGEFLMVFR